MPIEVDDAKPPLTAAQINDAERRMSVKLPQPYRNWLLRFNGGRSYPDRFRFKRSTGPYTDGVIAWLFAIYDGEYENLEINFETFKGVPPRLPDNLIPIARDPFGNLICLSIEDDDEGKVYFWDHEEESDTPDYSNCHLIADTFQQFIEGLH